jgi:hypothetical protein
MTPNAQRRRPPNEITGISADYATPAIDATERLLTSTVQLARSMSAGTSVVPAGGRS